jgi:hypothetical protein
MAETTTSDLLLTQPAKIKIGTRIRIDRIHTDGKPRRSGWSVVDEVTP